MTVKIILFDFDGVILDSIPIKTLGFEELFSTFPKPAVTKLLDYHKKNGGISRFVKIRYFFEQCLGQKISDDDVNDYANTFSDSVKAKLTNKSIIIQDSLSFIEKHKHRYVYHIVSGAEQNELRDICSKLEIAHYFNSIQGSPVPKKELTKKFIENYEGSNDEVIFIGDSINDFEAADAAKIRFFGYNNPDLRSLGEDYIDSFSNFNPG